MLIGHALKNAAVPIVTIIGIGVALLISGAIVTETVFALPGIGRLTVDAILRRDYPIIQGVILLFSGGLRAGQSRGRPVATCCSIRASGTDMTAIALPTPIAGKSRVADVAALPRRVPPPSDRDRRRRRPAR